MLNLNIIRMLNAAKNMNLEKIVFLLDELIDVNRILF